MVYPENYRHEVVKGGAVIVGFAFYPWVSVCVFVSGG